MRKAADILIEGAGLVFALIDDISKRDERQHQADIDETQHGLTRHPQRNRALGRKRDARHPQACKVESMRRSVRAFASPKARRAGTGVQPDLVLRW